MCVIQTKKFLLLCLVNYNAGINKSKQDLNHFHSSRIENLNVSCVELNNIITVV